MTRWLVKLALISALFVLAQPAKAQADEVTIEKGKYLWHAWQSTYKIEWTACEYVTKNKSEAVAWKSFERRVAAENDLASIAQFRRLPAQTKLYIPPTPCVTANLEAKVTELETALVTVRNNAAEDLIKARSSWEKEIEPRLERAANDARVAARKFSAWFWHPFTLILLLCVALLIAATVSLWNNRRAAVIP